MRGFLALEPDAATIQALREIQNRLRDALTRQGVSFPERLHAPILTWPFATIAELDAARLAFGPRRSVLELRPLAGFPHDDRPAEVGYAVSGAEALQAEAWELLRSTLDPDPPKPSVVRLARVSPPSRKVAAALRSTGLLGTGSGLFVAGALSVWHQTPQGFEIYYTIPLADGRP